MRFVHRLRWNRVLVSCLVLVCVFSGSNASALTVVWFLDSSLNTAIREVINRPYGLIFDEELARLTSLSLPNKGISSLTGLEYCTNLTQLSLEGNRIRDVRPLARLTKLARLTLHGNQIADISPLRGLTNLTVLDVGNNQVSDISSVRHMTSLSELGLYNNRVDDISVLLELASLTNLRVKWNQRNDVNRLVGLTRVELYAGVAPRIAGGISYPSTDSDGDGVTDFDETTFGSDPEDPNSFVHLPVSCVPVFILMFVFGAWNVRRRPKD